MFLKVIILFFVTLNLNAQEAPTGFAVGMSYGFGKEFHNIDYSYSNNYIQGQLYYSLNRGEKWEYVIAVQPEINFAKHQLLNPYFVTPDEPDYERKREEYLRLKDVNEYILNLAFFIKYNLSNRFSIYAMGNIGPMVTDTDTERLSKGFAFCDVLAFGTIVNFGEVLFDIRPNVRHTSNLGLNKYNAGFNTYNVAFGVIVPLK